MTLRVFANVEKGLSVGRETSRELKRSSGSDIGRFCIGEPAPDDVGKRSPGRFRIDDEAAVGSPDRRHLVPGLARESLSNAADEIVNPDVGEARVPIDHSDGGLATVG